MAVSLVPVGPGVDVAVAAVLKSHEDALRSLQSPGSPSQGFYIGTKADLLSKADPAAYRGCFAVVGDVPCLAISVETSPTVWEWKRADGSAL